MQAWSAALAKQFPWSQLLVPRREKLQISCCYLAFWAHKPPESQGDAGRSRNTSVYIAAFKNAYASQIWRLFPKGRAAGSSCDFSPRRMDRSAWSKQTCARAAGWALGNNKSWSGIWQYRLYQNCRKARLSAKHWVCWAILCSRSGPAETGTSRAPTCNELPSWGETNGVLSVFEAECSVCANCRVLSWWNEAPTQKDRPNKVTFVQNIAFYHRLLRISYTPVDCDIVWEFQIMWVSFYLDAVILDLHVAVLDPPGLFDK